MWKWSKTSSALARCSFTPATKEGERSQQTLSIFSGLPPCRARSSAETSLPFPSVAKSSLALSRSPKREIVIVPQFCRGFVDPYFPDTGVICLCSGFLDIVFENSPEPRVVFTDQFGDGINRHLLNQKHKEG